MAKLSTRKRNIWLKKLENKEVKFLDSTDYKLIMGYDYPRNPDKQRKCLPLGGDASINGIKVNT